MRSPLTFSPLVALVALAGLLAGVLVPAGGARAAPPAAPALPPRVGPGEARALGELVTVSVARTRSFDVLSSADLRRVVELEAEKATLGCDASSASCLAEVAGAMGARYVVFGQLATLGSQIVLTLNLYDSDKGSSSGRVVILGASLDELFPKIDASVDRLVVDAAPIADGAIAAGERKLRVLVLELESPKATELPDSVTVVENNTTPLGLSFWLLLGGGAVALGGVGAAASGAYFGVEANNAHDAALASTVQITRAEALVRREENANLANVLYVAGAGAAVVGAAAATASLFVGEAP